MLLFRLRLVLREMQTLLIAEMSKLVKSFKEIGPRFVMKFDHRRCCEVKLCNMLFSHRTLFEK